MEKNNYYLAMEKRLGDYVIIDINRLDITKYFVPNEIAYIDGFTSNFSIDEIKMSIMRSNMAKEDYLNGNLKIISDAKHNLKPITRDILNSVLEYRGNDIELSRDSKNRVFGVYKRMVEHTFEDEIFIKKMLDMFKEALREKDKEKMFSIIEELPYVKSRLIYLTISEELEKSRDINLRKLEKLNDNE